MPTFYSTPSQKRARSDEPISVTEHRPIYAIRNNHAVDDEDSVTDRKLSRCCYLSACPCLLGLLIGSLVAGLVLCVIISLWLTPTTKVADRLVRTSSGKHSTVRD
jgi:hypothetical protein